MRRALGADFELQNSFLEEVDKLFINSSTLSALQYHI